MATAAAIKAAAIRRLGNRNPGVEPKSAPQAATTNEQWAQAKPMAGSPTAKPKVK